MLGLLGRGGSGSGFSLSGLGAAGLGSAGLGAGGSVGASSLPAWAMHGAYGGGGNDGSLHASVHGSVLGSPQLTPGAVRAFHTLQHPKVAPEFFRRWAVQHCGLNALGIIQNLQQGTAISP